MSDPPESQKSVASTKKMFLKGLTFAAVVQFVLLLIHVDALGLVGGLLFLVTGYLNVRKPPKDYTSLGLASGFLLIEGIAVLFHIVGLI